ncbi:toll/interleukin-1 receptor domain-containing protein [Mesorhizobium sangaii]|uniref:TIR domain-containing protein n=1 Tax=Mesorhizobium sangaii TaxID=505389 RepID=A0A841PGU4_9HYPH|nr:toll/interleukin-1 receptor domain-containing protein [Mesorhizobium sangaii]MBB6411878.1 hypothetical protein [Mesorhizobium sangaii]
MKQWDVFISHASEDKEAFVEPLVIALRSVGLQVWYDKFTLKLGDSLSQSIDLGLVQSEYGIVVISPAFLSKPWPAYELAGLVTREIGARKVILPIWHHVTRDDVLNRSPTLADKLAVNTAHSSPKDIAMQILQVVRPDLYAGTDRAALIARMDGTALRNIEAELENMRDELREFLCPDCGAPLTESMEVPVTDDDSDNLRSFECGRRQIGSDITDPCPSSPSFPKFDAIPIQTYRNANLWSALVAPGAVPRFWLNPSAGRTEEEAIASLKEQYDRRAKKYDKDRWRREQAMIDGYESQRDQED